MKKCTLSSEDYKHAANWRGWNNEPPGTWRNWNNVRNSPVYHMRLRSAQRRHMHRVHLNARNVLRAARKVQRAWLPGEK